MEKKQFKKTLAVAQNVLNECIRHKILNILFIFAIAIIGGNFIIKELSPGAEHRTLIDAGYVNIEIFGFLALLFSIFIITYEEFEMRNIWITLTKPISRTTYFLGKFLGICLILFLNISIMFFLLMLLALLNGINLNINYLLIIASIFLELVVAIAFTLLFTVISSNLITGMIFSFFLFLIGHLTEHLKILINKEGTTPILKIILYIIYYLMPNLSLFNLKDKVYSIEGLFPFDYILKILIYASLYSVICLIISSLVFKKKEI
jgi:ABC-type transport system involved in multi-copper enzyme maturation permease subunit